MGKLSVNERIQLLLYNFVVGACMVVRKYRCAVGLLKGWQFEQRQCTDTRLLQEVVEQVNGLDKQGEVLCVWSSKYMDQSPRALDTSLDRAILSGTHALSGLSLLVGDRLSLWWANSVSALGRYNGNGGGATSEGMNVHSFDDGASQRF
jgi:hypothetical protein